MRFSFTPRRSFASLASLALLGTIFLSPQGAWAYSAQGHELVADVAELYLQQDPQGQAVLARVKTILAPDESMARASTWADRIKGEDTDASSSEDSKAFLAKIQAKFGNTRAHNPWHYVDVPLGAQSYSRQDAWTRPDDIVQMARICAQTLHDGASPSDAPVQLTQREALRLLIHYIGDEHQPLHVGCDYFVKGTAQTVMPTTQDLVTGRVVDDQGGNALTLYANGAPVMDDRGRPKKLHSYWDYDTVHNAMGAQTESAYARQLLGIAPQPSWNAFGAMKYWPKQWADDTLAQARIAYSGVTVLSVDDRGWDIAVPATYDQTSAALVQNQLAKGGYRLAQLLKAALGNG